MTGVLPVALQRMTRVIGSVVHSTKEYICVMQLHKPVDEDKLREVLREFTGRIYQRPPLRSSVKRSLRIKTINEIELLEYDGRYALLRVDCEAGTYMRKLCWDIGLVLGVGAHMRELRRTRTGPFSEKRNLVRLQDVAEALYRYREEGKDDLLRQVVLPGEFSICHLPKVVVRDTAVESIVHGASLAVPGVVMLHEGIRPGDTVAILTLKGELVALGEAAMDSNRVLEERRGIAFKLKRVIMKPGLYPKAWKSKKQAGAPGA
ncbi:MAG: RNA-guided pseudouridylation complex pseudouridine synthase subunit Cbf5 [Desulfurococcales archaeon]|nr:RNA-guided pseudouridylation complex pseudouridine synthase subunit Cbf5 [Desulfurococcales archaeon]